ncbi:DoxX family protein [Terriglobus sp. TAA 43]|uniref:DoxX family protein n=1 Tax=Terriglobus sp. TAA 43 TaxID=278961 RepID=UPI000646B217|nr:DoxX family protein [Terriglobus sp. TAA 43]
MGRFFDRLQPFALLVLRLVLGAALISASWHKVIPHGGLHGNNLFSAIEKWNHYVMTLGMPAWLGTVSALSEFLGGFCILLGLLTRLFGALTTITLIVGIAKVTYPAYDASKYPLAVGVLALIATAFGAGMLSLDRRLGLE